MTSNDPSTIPEPESEVVPAVVTDSSLATSTNAQPPVSPEEAAALKERAAALVRQLEDATGSQEMELVDTLSAVGIRSQRTAASDLALLRGRVGDLLSSDSTTGQVTKDLIDLRHALSQINPNEERSGLGRLASILPFGNKILDALERIAVRYETVSQQVVVVENRLEDGRLMLMRDNVELRKLYEGVEEQQLPLKRNAYLGELLMQELQALYNRTADSRKRDRVQEVLFDVSSRVQDLRTMEEVNNQFFVSIEMTRNNNTRLGQAVERTLALATNTLTIGLAIQSALARQKRVFEATERTRQFLGDLIVTNAAAIKAHTNEIGDVYRNPVIAMEKLEQAHKDLMEAVDTASRIKAEGIDAANQNIRKLTLMSAELEGKLAGLPTKGELPALEA